MSKCFIETQKKQAWSTFPNGEILIKTRIRNFGWRSLGNFILALWFYTLFFHVTNEALKNNLWKIIVEAVFQKKIKKIPAKSLEDFLQKYTIRLIRQRRTASTLMSSIAIIRFSLTSPGFTWRLALFYLTRPLKAIDVSAEGGFIYAVNTYLLNWPQERLAQLVVLVTSCQISNKNEPVVVENRPSVAPWLDVTFLQSESFRLSGFWSDESSFDFFSCI